jgi:hypothetical protein
MWAASYREVVSGWMTRVWLLPGSQTFLITTTFRPVLESTQPSSHRQSSRVKWPQHEKVHSPLEFPICLHDLVFMQRDNFMFTCAVWYQPLVCIIISAILLLRLHVTILEWQKCKLYLHGPAWMHIYVHTAICHNFETIKSQCSKIIHNARWTGIIY